MCFSSLANAADMYIPVLLTIVYASLRKCIPKIIKCIVVNVCNKLSPRFYCGV